MAALTSLLALFALAARPAFAIPPESFGFPSAPNDTALTVAYQYGSNLTRVTEGALFGVGIPASEPLVAVNEAAYRSLASYDGQYFVLMVDPDASTPQNPSKRFILHWAQPNLSPSNTATVDNAGQRLTTRTPAFVPYARPMPPVYSDAHRYILYAFKQPSSFSIPEQYRGFGSENRTNFNLTGFIAAAGLGTPAAANFFFCSNRTTVPANFSAAGGSVYPGGNGGIITAGPGPSPSPSATAATMSTSTALAAPASGDMGGLLSLLASALSLAFML